MGSARGDFYGHRIATDEINFRNASPELGLINPGVGGNKNTGEKNNDNDSDSDSGIETIADVLNDIGGLAVTMASTGMAQTFYEVSESAREEP
ncbi:hypothetical protein F4823DRAFT_568455 [Ustulina deusta]|nr:hypothetical protein F4823DRAFT_568455 [Ustulina deusta]